MILQVGVKVLLKNTEGKFLLLERNLEKYPEVGKENRWDIVGGRIEIGIPLIENLKREILEETKLTLKDEPKLIAAQDILRSSDKHVVRITYTAQIEGEPQLDEDHTAYKWFSFDELKQQELDMYFKELLDKFPDKLNG
jgi:ADP-ribose pyrophosphatase YjhB (NUDIX family)